MSSSEAVKPEHTTGSVQFTDAEVKFLLAVLRNLEGGLKFDKVAVAQELGMKDGGSVQARWNTINRTKIHARADGATKTATPASSRTASNSTRKGGKKRDAMEMDTTDAAVEQTPSKKRARKPKVEDVKEEAQEDDDEEASTEIKDEFDLLA